jgi:hypothetical protein
MSDCAKPDDHSHAGGNENEHRPSREAGRALLAGVLGGLASAAGYVVYSRLPEEQKDRLHRQLRTVVEARVNEIRSSLNL